MMASFGSARHEVDRSLLEEMFLRRLDDGAAFLQDLTKSRAGCIRAQGLSNEGLPRLAM